MHAVEGARLLATPQGELDALFGASEAGPVPNGFGSGTALMFPGTPYSAVTAQLIGALFWQGKTFFRDHGILTNSITPMHLPAVVAFVYEDASRFDGKPCIVLDYSRTSIAARYIRDELRLVAPGLYLGRAYAFNRFLFGFVLQFNNTFLK
ncbi:MAG TPA: hypothetical protein VFE17_01100 [Candidatus Baltobacteraceae bacterium]|jgi:hypothetical protein|nr:hypothetical protein [Candidatus Baltobacteraceae bacterium]